MSSLCILARCNNAGIIGIYLWAYENIGGTWICGKLSLKKTNLKDWITVLKCSLLMGTCSMCTYHKRIWDLRDTNITWKFQYAFTELRKMEWKAIIRIMMIMMTNRIRVKAKGNLILVYCFLNSGMHKIVVEKFISSTAVANRRKISNDKSLFNAAKWQFDGE